MYGMTMFINPFSWLLVLKLEIHFSDEGKFNALFSVGKQNETTGSDD
jgi:hypothetical protein